MRLRNSRIGANVIANICYMVGSVVISDGCSQIIQVNRVVSNARIPQTPRVALRTFWSFFHDLTTLFYATIALHQALSIYAIFFD